MSQHQMNPISIQFSCPSDDSCVRGLAITATKHAYVLQFPFGCMHSAYVCSTIHDGHPLVPCSHCCCCVPLPAPLVCWPPPSARGAGSEGVAGSRVMSGTRRGVVTPPS